MSHSPRSRRPSIIAISAIGLFLALTLGACRTLELEEKAAAINLGDNKDVVMSAMGTAQDRQFLGTYEVWQYCITGAGFGWHDYRAIWLEEGKVVGITSYKDKTPGSSCRGQFRTFKLEDAADYVVEVRNN